MDTIGPKRQLNNLRRLVRLAEEFRDGNGKFDMNSWASSIDERAPTTKMIMAGTCETTVDLGGLAGLDPYFRRQGLRTDFVTAYAGSERYVADLFSHAFREPELAELFGLNWLQFIEVFKGDNEITANGRVSKKRTLNRIIKALKRIAAQNFGEEL